LRALGRYRRLEEEVMREARVLRGKGPLIYPRNPIPGHVQAGCQRCLGQRSDMSG
jgi:hypothetical protein